MARLKYDFEMLTNIFNEAGATLLIDYKDKYITRYKNYRKMYFV